MKLYLADWNDTIKEVESEKQTEKFVFINGNRSAWKSSYSAYFLTYKQAKDYLIGKHELSVIECKRRLDLAESRLKKAIDQLK